MNVAGVAAIGPVAVYVNRAAMTSQMVGSAPIFVTRYG